MFSKAEVWRLALSMRGVCGVLVCILLTVGCTQKSHYEKAMERKPFSFASISKDPTNNDFHRWRACSRCKQVYSLQCLEMDAAGEC